MGVGLIDFADKPGGVRESDKLNKVGDSIMAKTIYLEEGKV